MATRHSAGVEKMPADVDGLPAAVHDGDGDGADDTATIVSQGDDASDTEYSDDSTTGWTSSSEEEEDEQEQDQDEDEDEDNSEDDDAAAAVQETLDDSPAAQEARAAERMRILQAAGLVVEGPPTVPIVLPPPLAPGAKKDEVAAADAGHDESEGAPQAGPSSKSIRGPGPAVPARRRPAPIPVRRKPHRPPPPPPPPPSKLPRPEEQMEDAYDRFMQVQRDVERKGEREGQGSKTSGGEAAAVAASAATTAAPTAPRDLQSRRRIHSSGSSRPTTPAAPGSSRPTTPSTPIGSAPSEPRSAGLLHSLASSFRSKTSTPQPERLLTASISGPLAAASAAPSSDGDSAQPAPPASSSASSSSSSSSTTWSSRMNADAVAALPDTERKRQEAIFELCQTESTHVRDLQTIVEVFYNHIEERKLLDEKARTVVFGNIEDVLLTAVSFLSDLEERQRASRLYVDHVGDVVSDHLPRMRAYVPYCTNQATAARILAAQRAEYPALDGLLQQLQASQGGRGLDLSSYLLTPMQRLTRYPLLLNQILKYTPEDHVDYEAIRQGIRTAEGILADTNERIRENESRERLQVLSQAVYTRGKAAGEQEAPRVDLTKPTRCLGARRVIKEETLQKVRSKSARRLTLVLCNDVLVILDGKGEGATTRLYRMPVPLEEVIVRTRRRGKDEGAFQIVIAGGQDKVDVRAPSVRAAHLWMRAIDEARSVWLAAVAAATSGGARSPRGSSSRSVSQPHGYGYGYDHRRRSVNGGGVSVVSGGAW